MQGMRLHSINPVAGQVSGSWQPLVLTRDAASLDSCASQPVVGLLLARPLGPVLPRCDTPLPDVVCWSGLGHGAVEGE